MWNDNNQIHSPIVLSTFWLTFSQDSELRFQGHQSRDCYTGTFE